MLERMGVGLMGEGVPRAVKTRDEMRWFMHIDDQQTGLAIHQIGQPLGHCNGFNPASGR